MTEYQETERETGGEVGMEPRKEVSRGQTSLWLYFPRLAQPEEGQERA